MYVRRYLRNKRLHLTSLAYRDALRPLNVLYIAFLLRTVMIKNVYYTP